MATPAPSAAFLVGYVTAAASAAWLGIGNLLLYIAMLRRGADIPSWRSGFAVLTYFRHRPPVRSRGLDVLAGSLLVAVATALVGIYLLTVS